MATQNIDDPLSANAWDQWARRAAQRAGLWVTKSRYRRDSWDNQGGYKVLDSHKGVIDGLRYDLNAEQVIERYGDDVDQLRLERIRTGQPVRALSTRRRQLSL